MKELIEKIDELRSTYLCSPELDNNKILIDSNMVLFKRILRLNDIVYQSGKTKAELAEKIEEMIFNVNDMDIRHQNDMITIQKLKTALALEVDIKVPVPDFINENKTPYIPTREVVELNGGKPIIKYYNISDVREMYWIPNVIKKTVISRGWRDSNKWRKLLIAWNSTCTSGRYEFDNVDNTQFALETIDRKLRDCEDGSILFVTYCRAMGIPANEVFMAVGPALGSYHAFPIVYLNNDDVRNSNGQIRYAGYYIFESTLTNMHNKTPKRLKHSNYQIDRGGLSNWQFAGQISGNYEELNCNTNVPATKSKKKAVVIKIDKSMKMHNKILKYWEQ